MNIVKLLADAYPGETHISDHQQTTISNAANYCEEWHRVVDGLFSALVQSIAEAAWPHEVEVLEHDQPGSGLQIVKEVLESYKDDIQALLDAVATTTAEHTAIWVIQSQVEKDDETGEPLYWSNALGWVDRMSATRYPGDVKEVTIHLPKDSAWRILGWPLPAEDK